MKRRDTRETKTLFINGYIYTLVKGRISDNFRCKHIKDPTFMGMRGWALQSIIKLKRNKFPKKKKNE